MVSAIEKIVSQSNEPLNMKIAPLPSPEPEPDPPIKTDDKCPQSRKEVLPPCTAPRTFVKAGNIAAVTPDNDCNNDVNVIRGKSQSNQRSNQAATLKPRSHSVQRGTKRKSSLGE